MLFNCPLLIIFILSLHLPISSPSPSYSRATQGTYWAMPPAPQHPSCGDALYEPDTIPLAGVT